MRRKKKGELFLTFIFVLLALYASWRFPWKGTWQALQQANLSLLLLATLVNLSSLVAKGWSWHLLLESLVPHRWQAAQKATFIGAAANCLSVSFVGEGFRVGNIVRQQKLPASSVITSLAWERLIEGIALSFLILFVPRLLPLPPSLNRLWLGALIVVGFFSLFSLSPFRAASSRFYRLLSFLNRSLPTSLSQLSSPRVLIFPLVLTFYNWIAAWLTFHLVLMAMNANPKLSASFLAMLSTNLAGLLRLTPANVGVFQASMVATLLVCGISAEVGMAASLALQGLQVIPVLLIAFIIILFFT
jgi:uncharacterized protein (TIRG00374 family)